MTSIEKIAFISLALALAPLPSTAAAPAQAPGRLVIVGGGSQDDAVMARFVELAGGKAARIVIFPQASGEQLETARDQAAQFLRLGAGKADWVIFPDKKADRPEDLAKLAGANAVFFTGGDQSRLVSLLSGTELLAETRRIHREGGVVGGTSAGAAAMSRVMLTGDGVRPGDDDPFGSIRAGSVATTAGFGFAPENIVVDQHFLTRRRQNRLLSVVLEHAGLIGIGVDENTALILGPGGAAEVAGDSLVTVLDPSGAGPVSRDTRGHLAARGVRIHLLKAGDKFRLPRPPSGK